MSFLIFSGLIRKYFEIMVIYIPTKESAIFPPEVDVRNLLDINIPLPPQQNKENEVVIN